MVDLAEARSQLRAAGTEDRAAWEQIQEWLLEAVGETTFEIWLDRLQLVAVDPDATLVIGLPELTGEWVRTRFARVLASAAERAGSTVRFANEVEHKAFTARPPAGARSHPVVPAGSLARQSPTERVSPRGGGSVSRQTDRPYDGRADTSTYSSSCTDVYNQTKEVS